MPNEQRHYSNELNLESVGINLPYNMQAEQSVLGAVLLKPETLTDLVEIIRPEMFYTRQNAQIYSEMLRLFTADQTIDFVTLLDAVISDGVFPSADEAKVYLTGLAETVPSISNVKAYAQIVQEKYLVRQLMGVAKDILQDAGDEPDADLLLENAEQRIYEIRSGRDSSALTPLSSSMVETLTNLQKISGPDADKYKGIPTGFRLLDTVHRVQQAEPGGDALVLVGIRAADLLQVGQRLHHAGGKRGQRAGIPPGADLVNALLRIFQQQVSVRFIACVLQNVLGNAHQLAHQILFLHDLGVCLHIGDTGHRLSQTGQVDLCLVRTGEHAIGDDGIQQGDKVDGLVRRKQAQHLRIDLGVLPGVEHLRPDDLHQIGQCLRLEQHRAQHALLGLHIVGQIDAHTLQIQFIGIMSLFVGHGSSPSILGQFPKTPKTPPEGRGRRWRFNQACSTSTMILKEATTPTCRRTFALNTPASLMSLVSSSIFFLSMGEPASWARASATSLPVTLPCRRPDAPPLALMVTVLPSIFAATACATATVSASWKSAAASLPRAIFTAEASATAASLRGNRKLRA